jgi:Xaa-Pro dipeptidase
VPEHGVSGPDVSRGPELPAGFSGKEMRRRRGELDAVLEQADLRHVLVHGANRAGSAVQWLTGWPVTREALVVHGVGEADTLLGPAGHLQRQ